MPIFRLVKGKNHAHDAPEFLRNKTLPRHVQFRIHIPRRTTPGSNCLPLARCGPRNADKALLSGAFTRKREFCIGDGWNGVSTIQAADVGVHIVGRTVRLVLRRAFFWSNSSNKTTHVAWKEAIQTKSEARAICYARGACD